MIDADGALVLLQFVSLLPQYTLIYRDEAKTAMQFLIPRDNRFGALLVGMVSLMPYAHAHPHVWVAVETTVVYDGGMVTGFRYKWTFDKAYSATAIHGLDGNRDGTYSREELSELAKANIDGLKEFNYFTYAKLGDMPLALGEPVDYWHDVKEDVLSLHFELKLAVPVFAEAQGFSFSVYDPSFFIAFNFAKDVPIHLSDGAPSGCSARVELPSKDAEQLRALNQAFGGQLTAGDANMGTGSNYAPSVNLACNPS